MKLFSRESSLKPFVRRYLLNQGYDVQRPEVQFFDRRIDLMGLSDDDSRIIAIEMKLKKWREAFQQALLYQLCCDFVVVAFPAENTNPIELGRFKRHGIGVLRIFGDGKHEMIAEPDQSSVMKLQYKQRYMDYLKRYRNVSKR